MQAELHITDGKLFLKNLLPAILKEYKVKSQGISQSYILLMREYLHEFKGGLETHFTQYTPSTFLKKYSGRSSFNVFSSFLFQSYNN